MVSSNASVRRLVATLGLVLVAFVIAWLGRWLLDSLAAIAPQWSNMIERFGGWIIGMIVVVAVLLPLFRLYGVLAKHK
jgi:hypothetical protein